MTNPSATLVLYLPTAAAGHFSALFSSGVGIKTIAGISLTDLLCGQLAIAPEYVERRIQTIFLNHRAVDRAEQVIVPADAVLALSAAMPGLVGATLRKGGVLSNFRKDISYRSLAQKPSADRRETLITLKLFNLVADELGPHLLAKGIWISSRVLTPLLSRIFGTYGTGLEAGQLNGRTMSPAELCGLAWDDEGWVALRVAWIAR